MIKNRKFANSLCAMKRHSLRLYCAKVGKVVKYSRKRDVYN